MRTTPIFRRTGADYVAISSDGAGYLPHRWARRTSSGWQALMQAPVHFKASNGDDEMVLVCSDERVYFIRRTVEEKGYLKHAHNAHEAPWCVLARGKLRDLWELFLSHGHMMVGK